MIIFLLSISAMILAAVCSIYSNFPTVVRALCVAYLILATLIIVGTTASYRGAPIYKKILPEDLIIYGQWIDKEGGYINMLYSANRDQEPTYIKTDYDLNLHKALQQGSKMAKGEPFQIKKEGGGDGDGKEGEGKGKGKGKGDAEGGGDGAGSMSLESQSYRAYLLPSPKIPEKTYN